MIIFAFSYNNIAHPDDYFIMYLIFILDAISYNLAGNYFTMYLIFIAIFNAITNFSLLTYPFLFI